MRVAGDQRGFALVVALWALLLLSSIGGVVAMTAREQSWLAAAHAERAAARWAAEAGTADAEARLAVAMLALPLLPSPAEAGSAALEGDEETRARWRLSLRQLNALDSLFAQEGEHRLPNGAVYRLRAHDATSRLNLNAAGEPELRGFFAQWVLDERDLAILVESLLDWRDEDDSPRAQGAESDHYARLRQPYSVRNGPLLSARELLLIRGMTPELFRRVERYVTTLPTRELRVNINTAPAPVLLGVPGITAALAARMVARRLATGPFLSAAELASDPELAPLLDRAHATRAVSVITVQPELMEISSTGRSSDAGPEHRILALYALERGALRRLEWREVEP